MGFKKSQALMSMFAAMAMSDGSMMGGNFGAEPVRKLTKEEKEDMKRVAEIKRNKKNGLTGFVYGDTTVWALNKKNADRKAKREGLI